MSKKKRGRVVQGLGAIPQLSAENSHPSKCRINPAETLLSQNHHRRRHQPSGERRRQKELLKLRLDRLERLQVRHRKRRGNETTSLVGSMPLTIFGLPRAAPTCSV